ncbi:mechanosensitive ion channel [Candidatus Roizmanbacteria bacterium]|nr:mechanosensitive ion channel [Candidatus Roizmanbacteria bacterium]
MPFNFSPELAKTLFYLSVTILIAIAVDQLLRSLIRVPPNFDTRRSRTYVTILRNLVTIIVYAATLYIILVELGINITPLLASASILGLTIGIGARALVEDLIAGLFLLSQDSIALGDFVKIEDAEGYIERIGLRTFTIRDGTGALHIIPNGQIKKVINFSRHKTRFPVGITMKADQSIDTVLKAANQALTLLEKEKDLTELLFPGSIINGIENFTSEGHLILKATLILSYENHSLVARRFRYLLKKEFEKHKIHLG